MADIELGGRPYKALCSQDEADAFLAGDVSRATSWALRDIQPKRRGLISATRMMLALPWSDGPPNPDADDSPAVLAEVCAMLACDLLAKPKLFADASANSNVKNVKAGSAQVEFFRPVDDAPPLPLALWRLLEGAGLVTAADGPTDFSADDAPFVSGSGSSCAAPGAAADHPPYWTDFSRGGC
jgi:hypothetical protein